MLKVTSPTLIITQKSLFVTEVPGDVGPHCCWEPEDGSGPMGASGLEGVSPDKQQVTLVCRQKEGPTCWAMERFEQVYLQNEVMIFPRKHTDTENQEWENKTEHMKDEMLLGTSLNINHQKYQPTVRVRCHHQPAQSGLNKEDDFKTGWRKQDWLAARLVVQNCVTQKWNSVDLFHTKPMFGHHGCFAAFSRQL